MTERRETTDGHTGGDKHINKKTGTGETETISRLERQKLQWSNWR